MLAIFAVVIIAPEGDPRPDRLRNELRKRTKSLRDARESLEFFDASTLIRLDSNTPAVCVVFCSAAFGPDETAAVKECQKKKLQIFPVVKDLKELSALAPDEVKPFNGFELRSNKEIPELAGLVLEGLGLQRGRRKIFISYARMDSAAIAQQLREAFTRRWYTVFHDVVSIRPGRTFQEELLQELADADVMLLLNSPNVGMRPYVQKEITFASQAGLGIVQAVWPDVTPRNDLFAPTIVRLDQRGRLHKGSRRVPLLSNTGVNDILHAVAEERTKIQVHREDELRELISAYARSKNWKALSHLGRYVTLSSAGLAIRLDIALGVPTSMELERAWRDGAEHDPKRIVYNRMGLTNAMSDHLAFLSKRLPIELLDVEEAASWRVIP
jgi:hypothetical protein